MDAKDKDLDFVIRAGENAIRAYAKSIRAMIAKVARQEKSREKKRRARRV